MDFIVHRNTYKPGWKFWCMQRAVRRLHCMTWQLKNHTRVLYNPMGSWALSGDHTFVPIHTWAHTIVPRHVCAQTRLCPDSFVPTDVCAQQPRHVCAHTRIPDTFVLTHVCAQTRLCSHKFVPRHFVPSHVCDWVQRGKISFFLQLNFRLTFTHAASKT